MSGNATPLKCKSPKGKVWRGQRSVKDCSINVVDKHGKVVDDAIDFSFYQQAGEQQQQQQEEEGNEEARISNDADLLRQFRRLFAPIVDDSLQLYYQLNEEDDRMDTDVQHIRIHRTVAELQELTSSEEETLVTQLNSPLPMEPPLPATPSGSSMSSSTSSRCLYAIHTPLPGQRLESPLSMSASASSEPHTITEQVQLHAPPLHIRNNNNNEEDEPSCSHNNKNTSCSLSSTLTDSKTLDGRTPIVV